MGLSPSAPVHTSVGTVTEEPPLVELPLVELPLVELPAGGPAMQSPPSQQKEAAKICWPPRRLSSGNYQPLATRLLAQDILCEPATLLFTSPADGDGKTEVVIGLAPALAAKAQRAVLVVDADFRRGDLSCRLAAFNDGLSGLRSARSAMAEVVCPTTITQLSLLPHGDDLFLDEESEGQISGWRSVFDDLKRQYPLVLLDAPSLAHQHVAALGAACDGVCLVVRLGQTSRRAVGEAAQVIASVGGQLIGCVALGR